MLGSNDQTRNLLTTEEMFSQKKQNVLCQWVKGGAGRKGRKTRDPGCSQPPGRREPRGVEIRLHGAESLAKSELRSAASGCLGYRSLLFGSGVINETNHMHAK